MGPLLLVRWRMSSEKEVDYKIACHHTLAQDGTVLNNDEPAPPEFIEWHEKKTKIRAPPEAATWKLSEVNLFFLSGGVMLPK